MKNLFIILFLFCSFTSFAQIQKGTIVVGGGINFNGDSGNSTNISYNDTKRSSGNLGIAGTYEKFINNSTAVGFSLTYRYYSYLSEYDYGSGTQEYGTKRNMIQVGPTLIQYISLREKLYLTIGGGITAGYGTRKDIETDEKSKILSFGLGVQPGVTFFLNNNFAISAGIGNLFYSFESEKYEEDDTSGETPKEKRHNYGLNLSLNTFNVGLKYFLRTSKTE